MNEYEFRDMERRIDEALIISKKKMLAEKALHGESIVVYDSETHGVIEILASDVLKQHPEFRM